MSDPIEKPANAGERAFAALFWIAFLSEILAMSLDYFPDAHFDYAQTESVLGVLMVSGLVGAILCHKLDQRA